MSEVLRFQLARSPQRKSLDETGLLKLYPGGPSGFIQSLSKSDAPSAAAKALLEAKGWLAPALRVRDADENLTKLDEFLLQRQNRVDLEQLMTFFGSDERQARERIQSHFAKWKDVRIDWADGLVASLLVPEPQRDVTPELRGDLVRKLNLSGLLDLVLASPRSVKSADQISAAIRSRILVLPEELLSIARDKLGRSKGEEKQTARSRRRYVTRTGVSDLYVLKSEWVRYEAGEIAHIENVLPRELKHREHVRTDEREETATKETEISALNEQDTQSADRFELNDEASQDTKLALHVDGKVDTAGTYGVTKVDTHVGGSLDFSQEDSHNRAVKQSRETVSRAITKVEQHIREARTTRTLTRIQETNTHSLDNSSALAVAGIYRWVDKVQRFQLFRYPNRLLLEFQVPEPAAWWRWFLGTSSTKGLRTRAPEDFTIVAFDHASESMKLRKIQATDITPGNYAEIAARYDTAGLEPPPASKVLVAETFSRKSRANSTTDDGTRPKHGIEFSKVGQVTIPTGYVPEQWWWNPMGWVDMHPPENEAPSCGMLIGVGNKYNMAQVQNYSATDRNWHLSPDHGAITNGPFSIHGDNTYKTAPYDQRNIPIYLREDNLLGYAFTITIECTASSATLDKWRIATYEKIADAYYALKREHEEEVAAARIRAGVFIEGDSPTRNAEVIREQLKLGVLRQLFGDATKGTDLPFTWDDLIDRSDSTGGPKPKAEEAANRAPLVQFLEHAFEWDKLTYVLYPYFWAANWPDIADIKSPDAEFARFLRSGSARVVAPVRPGFEAVVEMFLDFGVIWGGGAIPAIGDPQYLSIADEIRAIHNAPDDGEPLDWWEERLPTTLTWIDGAGTLPEKPASQIKLGAVAPPARKELPAPGTAAPIAVPAAPPAPSSPRVPATEPDK